MPSFDELYGDFLAERRNGATMELLHNEKYAGYKTKQKGLYEQLMALLGPEAQAVIEKYREVDILIQGMEHNNIFFCGMITLDSILKRLDKSTP